MAQLKDTVVTGSLRATDTIYSTTNQFTVLHIPTASNGTTFGPGTNGQILKSNGTSVYWASDNNSDVNVTQAAAITTAGAYPLILANSTATTAVTGTVNKTSTLTYNPNTKALVTGGTVNGYTLAAACAKGVTDNSSNTDVTSSDTNLITGRTLYYQLAKKGYTTNTGTVTKVSTGVGLIGGDITGTGTIKAKLKTETAHTADSAAQTNTASRQYMVGIDKSGYLSVNVPWANDNTKNTAGTTNKTGVKMFLVAATEQSANPTTYSNSNCYIGTDNCLYSGGTKVLTAHQSISGKLNISGGSMTGRLTTNKALNMVLTGTGVAGGDRGSSAKPRYFPAVWTFNAGITPQDGDIVSIKIPCAGHDYGVFLSTNNGTNSYPIVYNTNARLTTHFPNAAIITVQFDSAGSAASMFALAGQNNTTRVTVSGGVWRILNLYDSGNSNDTGTLVRDYGGNVAVVTTTAATYRYQLLFPIYESTNFGYKYIPANTTSNTIATTKTTIFTGEFNPLEPILYYSHTDTVNANATIRADRLWRTYPIDLRYSFNTGTTLAASKDVYIVATLQSNGMAKLRNPANVDANASAATGTGPITQTLPSTDDGYIYILLGRAYNTTTVDVCYMHPVYYYRGGQIRRYTGNSPTTLTVTAASTNWNSSKQQSITATGVTANNTIIVGLASNVTATQYDAAADAKIVCTAQAANSITVTCLGDKPAVNIPLSVVIID